MRIYGTIQARPAEVFAASEAVLLLSASGGPYDLSAFARVKGPIASTGRGRPGRVLGAEGAPRAAPGRPGGLGAGQALSPRAAGEGLSRQELRQRVTDPAAEKVTKIKPGR